jgi:hypothetical protein
VREARRGNPAGLLRRYASRNDSLFTKGRWYYLKHLLRAENPTDQRELAQRHAVIKAGRGVSLTEAKQRLDRG